jgi:L-ascorbate metabolism protein UlaG (beta-lactamase superfamily)
MHPHINRCHRDVLLFVSIVCNAKALRCLLQVMFLLLFGGLVPGIAGAQGEVRLSYLGTAGWEITDGKTVILVDPYLSRLKLPTPNDAVLPDDSRPLFGWDSSGVSDEAVIDAHIKKADFILITHTHLDHTLDLPYIARKTGAMVIGTESTVNLARTGGVPGNQLMGVRGGDDLEFGVFSLRVIPSLHGILRRALNMPPIPGPPPPEIFPPDAKPPFHLRDYVQGGTLAYFIRLNGVKLLVFGSMNYIEREVEGLRPDAALIGAMPERREIYQYTARLLRALGEPPLVLPTHWDRFNVPYGTSQQPAIERLQSFLAEVKESSPSTHVIVPEYFQPIVVKANQSRATQNK